MVMYDNEYKTKEIKIEPRIKLNRNMFIAKVALKTDRKNYLRSYNIRP